MTDTEVEVAHLPAGEHQRLLAKPEAGKRQGSVSPESLKEPDPVDTLVLDF